MPDFTKLARSSSGYYADLPNHPSWYCDRWGQVEMFTPISYLAKRHPVCVSSTCYIDLI